MPNSVKIALLGLLLLAVLFFALEGTPQIDIPSRTDDRIEGVIVDYKFVQEDGSHLYVIFEFEDGKVMKFRSHYKQPVIFKKGALNRITYNSNQDIKNIEYDYKEKEKQMQLK